MRGELVQSGLERPIDPRFDREGDWDARQMFSEADLRKSPEEYAARRGHLWLCFSLHLYRYRDPVMGAWVKRFEELIRNREELERLRKQLLTDEERAEIRRQEAEDP
jgi:hypothetical protein